MIGILDYGMGNIKSVYNSLDWEGFDVEIVSDVAQLDDLTHLIVPGVGAYFKAMENLKEKALIQPLQDFVASGRPVLGICLGMQILSTLGTEGHETPGLDWISGRVDLMELDDLPVPHMGWNALFFHQSHPILEGIKDHVDYYFVHSYRFHIESESDLIASTEYGSLFPSIVAKNNVVGVQFHPEKSQENGLRMLSNFCEWDGTC